MQNAQPHKSYLILDNCRNMKLKARSEARVFRQILIFQLQKCPRELIVELKFGSPNVHKARVFYWQFRKQARAFGKKWELNWTSNGKLGHTWQENSNSEREKESVVVERESKRNTKKKKRKEKEKKKKKKEGLGLWGLWLLIFADDDDDASAASCDRIKAEEEGI